MSRPSRSVRAKNYAESSDSDVQELDEEDESFDEDEDPDKMEVPDGGLNLEAAVKSKQDLPPGSSLASANRNEPKASSARSIFEQERPGSSVSYNYFNPGINAANTGIANHDLSSNFSNAALLMAGNSQLAFPNLLEMPHHQGLEGVNAIQGLHNFFGTFPLLQNNFLDLFRAGFPYGNFHQFSGTHRSRAENQPQLSSAPDNPKKVEPQEEDHQEDEAMGVAETYADYRPAKLNIGKRHPDPVVETASMASVLPPEITYKLKLPQLVIEKGLLSALQLEAVVYACQQHEFILPSRERAGYLIGDGAGVGKGRTIAGIIFENSIRGRKKAIWVSVSSDLKYDSERDLKDVGANIDVVALNKLKYGKISMTEGVIFSTYSSLIGESSQSGKFNTRLKQLIHWCGDKFDGVIVFDECHRAKNLCAQGSTKPTKTGLTVHELQKRLPLARIVYASATGASEPRNMAYMTRLGIWGPGTPFDDFSAFIQAVERRGVGAMEIVAMDMKLRGAYIARQLSFQGVNFKIEEVPLTSEFIKTYDLSVELWVELMHKFIEAVTLMKTDKAQRKAIWAQFWSAHQRFFKYLCIAAKVKRVVQIATDAVKFGKCVVIGLQSTGEARTLDQLERDDGELTDFVSTAKGVLQSLVEKHFPTTTRVAKILERYSKKTQMSEEVTICEPDAGASSSNNKRKPVRKAAQNCKRVKLDSDDSDFELNPNADDSDFEMPKSGGSSESYVSESSSVESEPSSDADSDTEVPTAKKRKEKKSRKVTTNSTRNPESVVSDKPTPAVIAQVEQMRKQLLAKIEALGTHLPPNALDQLIDELGGPEDVAEMTGRKGRVILTEGGKIEYESRAEVDVPLETINLTEKQRFMNGEKKIAIISEAASSGISLQSDRRAKNTLRRVHITLELPWSADRAIQQFGRTHRSNQMYAPEYVFMISDLAGEHRFASIVAKRLESLGALTHGDRRASESRDLSKFNIDTKYGREALEIVMRSIMVQQKPVVEPPKDYSDFNDFYDDVRGGLLGVGLIVNDNGNVTLDKEHNNISKFLNRILGMPVKLQNNLFQYFTDTLSYTIAHYQKNGAFDMGILDLGDSGSGALKRLSTHVFTKKHSTGVGRIELHRLLVERGLSWDDAMKKYAKCTDDDDGFYLTTNEKREKKTAVLVIAEPVTVSGDKAQKDKRLYTIYRPSTGLQLRKETRKDFTSKYEKREPELVKTSWEHQYKVSEYTCSHAFWGGNCKGGAECDVGRRTREYNVLSGSVLMVWQLIEKVLSNKSASYKMLVVRVRHEDLKLVGVLIPKTCKDEVIQALKKEANFEKVTRFDDHEKDSTD